MTQAPHPNELRDHLANVRTLLAWVRTAITIMAFGFVVAKFGILLKEIRGSHAHTLGLHFSALIGTVLVLIGAVFLGMATLNFLQVRRDIDEQKVTFRPTIHIVLSSVLMLVAVVLAVYILLTA